MFDDNLPRNSEPPKNLPLGEEPKDMFSDVDKIQPAESVSPVNTALNNGALKKKNTEQSSSEDYTEGIIKYKKNSDMVQSKIDSSAEDYKIKEPIFGRIVVIFFIIILVLGLGYGGWKFYSDYTDEPIISNLPEKIEKNNDLISDELPSSLEEIEDIIVEEEPENEIIIPDLDFDKDGLSDEKEKELNTDPKLDDTDEDGLIDGDEVNIWKTDPLDSDSDDDGYLDGEEIKNGYNPLGNGELFSDIDDIATSSPEL